MGDEWTNLGYTTEVAVEAHDIGPEVMALLFGQVPSYESPTHSVLLTYTDKVSGRPARPILRKARWWDRATKRANAEATRRWMWDLTTWEMSGRPDIEVERRMFVPRASIEHTSDGVRVTPRG